MDNHNYPILEFDPAPRAIIEPSGYIPPRDVPERCVLCFFPEVLEKVASEHNAQVAAELGGEAGRRVLYEIPVNGQRVGFIHPGVGAPLAVITLEALIAFGVRKLIACGGAGVLDGSIDVGQVLVPVSAVRDEGTSYHYLPPGREVAPPAEAVAAIEATLQAHGVPFHQCKTWTTDGVYRETAEKVARRRAEGCLTVEMEAAAFFAVAQFRQVMLGQILYGGDDVSGEAWDHRDWIAGRASTREKLFWLAAEAALKL